MSEVMYNEVGTDGKGKYQKNDWRKIISHTSDEVCGFFGEYSWLSNFHPCPVYFEETLYPSSENAYQAAKVIPHDRDPFITCSPAESKKIWKKGTSLYTSETWDQAKNEIMMCVVFDKFYRNKDLRQKLIDTQFKYLREDNWWSDVWYGYDVNLKRGENYLGRILMKVRKFWTEQL